MSGSSGKDIQQLSFSNDDLEVKYKLPKFEALSNKYKKFEEKKIKVEKRQKAATEPTTTSENEEKE